MQNLPLSLKYWIMSCRKMEKHAVPVQHCLVTITGVLNYVLQEDEKART